MTSSEQRKNLGTSSNSASFRPLLAQLSCLAALALVTFAALAAPAPQSGGIVPTEYSPIGVEPGPEPDVTFFATGDTLGKIEPCG
jgi:hypothetical protein